MTTLTGHLSLYATQSLKSIDNWMNVVQGNIGGSLVTAYKQVELNYAGGLTHEIRSTTNLKNGVMIGEQVLTTGNTRVDWKQGEVISSTQDTHFAIQGDGFFLAVDPKQSTLTGGYFTGQENGVYLTRKGDFHFGKVLNAAGVNIAVAAGITADPEETVLVNEQGMLLMADLSDGPNLGNSDNIHIFITKTNFYNSGWGPSVVQPTYDAPNTVTIPNRIVDYDELQYSKYGSSLLKAPTSTAIKTIISGAGGNYDSRTRVSPSANGENRGDYDANALLIPSALEASNVRVERNITELAVMGKIYNGFVQLIKVYNSNLDEVLAFIR